MSPSPEFPIYDAIIVGARCAGAATAMLMARAGMRVLVLDREQRGKDTLSTHALMRGAVIQLDRWGLLDAVRASNAQRITRTSFQFGDDRIEIPIRPSAGVDGLYAPRRYVLDALLADAAWNAGADIRFGWRVIDLLRDASGAVMGVTARNEGGSTHDIRAGLVVGADGRNSTVARQLGMRTPLPPEHGPGTLYAYFELESDGYEWGYAPGLMAGAIPTNDGLACIFVSARREDMQEAFTSDPGPVFHSLIAKAAPWLLDLVAQHKQKERIYGFGGAAGFVRPAYGRGWALVGDAGCFKDPCTAHGITDALRDAELLARAAADQRPSAFATYQSQRNALSHDLLDITDRIAALDWTMDEIPALCRSLADSMKPECTMLSALAPIGAEVGLPVISAPSRERTNV